MSEISKLFGHNNLFNELIYLDQVKKLPNKILINGPKGIGKIIILKVQINLII